MIYIINSGLKQPIKTLPDNFVLLYLSVKPQHVNGWTWFPVLVGKLEAYSETKFASSSAVSAVKDSHAIYNNPPAFSWLKWAK